MATTPVDLYRSLNRADWPSGALNTVDNQPFNGVLYPAFVDKPYVDKAGKPQVKDADVTVVVVDGESRIDKGGTSLFDALDVFKPPAWFSFKIPIGTEIPPNLKVVKGDFNKRFKATHYQIEALTGGTINITTMQGALDNFARAALVKSLEAANL